MNRKQISRAASLLLAGIMGLALTACGSGGTATSPSPSAEAKRTSLILGLDDSFPPMGYQENGEIVGFDIDVAKALCELKGWELKLQPITWSANEMELNSGNVDCLWNGMTLTEARKETMSCSDPYMNNNQVVVVMKDSPYQSLADLKGKKLALQTGSSAEEALKNNPEFKAGLGAVNTFDDNMMALMDMESGASDAVLMDEIVANYYIADKGSAYRVIGESLASEEYGIGFRKADTALRDEVNEGLKELAKNGKLAEISTKWFGKDVTTIKAD